MPQKPKKQYRLSIPVRVFLVALVVISVGVFARSVMYYNQLNEEAERLGEELDALYEIRAELEAELGSAERLREILADYEECREIKASGTTSAELLDAYEEQMARVRELLNQSKNKNYIERVARERLNLYYADEEIYYNDLR